MTAEEKLKELYEAQSGCIRCDDGTLLNVVPVGLPSICLTAEHIDLIANLVVERLKNATHRD